MNRWQIEALTVGVYSLREMLVERRRRQSMTPKFRGVAEKLKKLQHHLDHEAGKLDARIDQTMGRSHDVFEKSHKSVAQAHEHLDGIDEFLTDLEKTNQGPGGPLDGSDTAPRSTEVATRKVA